MPGQPARTKVIVLDLSASGFRMRAPVRCAPNTDIFLELPNQSPQVATIVWVDGNLHGCRFTGTLEQAVVLEINAQAWPA